MAELLTPDLCVIGGGAGGLSVAAGAVQMGASVVLVEARRLGGDCLNSGCVPSKALIAAARVAHALNTAEGFGIRLDTPEIDFKAVMDHVQAVIETIARHDSAARFEGLGVRLIEAKGRFVNRRAVEAGGMRIRARRFVIATGSRPIIPPIPGLETTPYLTTDTLFGLSERPDQLLIIGAGAVGVELAQAFRRLGVPVTLFEAATMLGEEEPELVDALRTQLRREGIEVWERVQIRKIEPGPTVVFASSHGREERRAGTHLLLATGRRPTVEDLGLEAAGIRFSEDGIAVDHRLRTSNRRVFALGDCTGGPQFSHLAGWQAAAVVQQILFRLPVRAIPRALPRVVFTDPELARVGLTVAEARARGISFRVVEEMLSQNHRACAERVHHGRIRVLVSPFGRILGCSILAPKASELIVPWVLAIERHLPLSALARCLIPYPTYSEISKRAAGSFFASFLFSQPTRRLVRLLARLG